MAVTVEIMSAPALKRHLRILHLEDSQLDTELVAAALAADGLLCEISRSHTRKDFEVALEQRRFDLILADFSLPAYEGTNALIAARRLQPDTPFLFVSGTIGEEQAVESLKAGATDYVLKGHLNRLGHAVRRALREAEDRTKHKLLEAQLLQAQKMEAVGQLAGGVAHDFNNLLTVIRTNSELVLLDEKQLSPEARESLTQVVAATERAANLTRQLLVFSRKHLLQPQSVSLNEIVANLAKMLGRVIGEDIRLECRYAPNLPYIHADPGMMEQILMNVVINARDAMPEGGELLITTERLVFEEGNPPEHPEGRAGEFACLSVADTGTGIAPEHLPRIFEPFFTTKEPGKGTGLGLATVYGILQQHKGWVEVRSRPGEGTVFKMYLPALRAAATALGSESLEPKTPGDTESILLVEDEEQVRILARRILKGLGYKLMEAASGKAALCVWEEQNGRFDLLLTDMIMPEGVTGRELAQTLCAKKPGLKVLFTSGYQPDATASDTNFFERKGVHFLAKPYSSRALARAVRESLDTV